MRTHIKSLLVALFLGVSLLPGLTFAQVQLPTVNLGLTNFEDGFAVPGWFLQEFPDYYDADKLNDARGATVPGSNHLITFATTTHIVYVTQQHVMGGWLSFEALQPWVHVHVDLANAPPTTVHGLADLTLGAGVQWEPTKIGGGIFAHRLLLDVTVPTGPYNDRQPVNLSNHYVVVEPYYAVTYEISKVEFSARLHYFWNSVNHDPFVGFGENSTQPGQAFHVNYAASYEVVHDVRVGFNGYWLQQTTDHKANAWPSRIPWNGLSASVAEFKSFQATTAGSISMPTRRLMCAIALKDSV